MVPLMLSYNNGAPYNAAEKADTNTGYGYSLGGYFNVMPTLVVAASYQSQIAMKYGTQISGAGAGFNLTTDNFGDDLNQPAEIKAGVAYTMSNITLTADYKQIKWGSAAGYKDFNWKDQKVMAIGAKYAGDGYWLGLGYNKANDPIGAVSPSANPASVEYRNAAVNFFNNMFFPAVVKDSYTFGGGYDISKTLALETSVVISPKVTKTVDVTAVMLAGGAPAGTYTNTTTHSQQAASLSLRYKF